MPLRFDVVIKRAQVVDGTGNPAYKSDIGLAEGKIAALEPDLGQPEAGRIIEAEGLVASPGFIDVHSHDDAYVLKEPAAGQKVMQGVTTVVVGNCGFSLAPNPDDRGDYLAKIAMLMGGGVMPAAAQRISSFADYLDQLEAVRPGINVAPLVGHATIRIAALGWENRPPSPEELATMKRLTAQAMEEGAVGLSTGLIYVPATFARTDEIVALAEIAGQYQGVYATHLRNEGDTEIEAIEEAIQIGRRGGLPVQVSHHKIAGRENWGNSEATLALFARARAEGVEVTCDQYPYPAGSTILAAALPPSLAGGGPDVYAEKLKDPEVRKAAVAEIEQGGRGRWENLIKGAGFEGMVISFSRKHPEYLGRSIAEIARGQGRSPYDAFFDLVAEEKMDVGMIIFMMEEADIERIMKDRLTMIGSDGIPGYGESRIHPRQTSTFPRVLGRYVRERQVLGLEEAVRKMTSLPAQTFRLKSKGLLKEGFDADLVLFDPETVLDRGTYEEPMLQPAGIPWVLVNGQVAVEDGRFRGANSGRVLRHRV